jgi:hypothetical protein
LVSSITARTEAAVAERFLSSSERPRRDSALPDSGHESLLSIRDPGDILGSDTIGRLAARIVELADRYGTSGDVGVEIELALSQDECTAGARRP